MSGRIRSRIALLDIGAAGPLAGMVVALPVLAFGLSRSHVAPNPEHYWQEGQSLLYLLMKRIFVGPIPDGEDVQLHPTANAGWVGLLVTMINLIPIGQLDGGHIATAYFGNGYSRFATRLHRILPFGAVAVFLWVMHATRIEAGAHWNESMGRTIALVAALPWLVWYMMIRILRAASGGVNHPPVDETPRISNSPMPGPLVRTDTPGTDCIRLLRSVTPRSCMSAPDTAVKLIAVFCTVLSRFSAVTTISSSCPESE